MLEKDFSYAVRGNYKKHSGILTGALGTATPVRFAAKMRQPRPSHKAISLIPDNYDCVDKGGVVIGGG